MFISPFYNLTVTQIPSRHPLNRAINRHPISDGNSSRSSRPIWGDPSEYVRPPRGQSTVSVYEVCLNNHYSTVSVIQSAIFLDLESIFIPIRVIFLCEDRYLSA